MQQAARARGARRRANGGAGPPARAVAGPMIVDQNGAQALPANARTELLAQPANATARALLNGAPVVRNEVEMGEWMRVAGQNMIAQGEALADVARQQGLGFEELRLGQAEGNAMFRELIAGVNRNVGRRLNVLEQRIGGRAEAQNAALALLAANQAAAHAEQNAERARAARQRQASARQRQESARQRQESRTERATAAQRHREAMNTASRAEAAARIRHLSTAPFWHLDFKDMPQALKIRLRAAWWKSLLAGAVVFGAGLPAAAATICIYWPASIAAYEIGRRAIKLWSIPCLALVVYGQMYYIHTTRDLVSIHQFYNECEKTPQECRLALRATWPLQVATSTAWNGAHLVFGTGNGYRNFYALPPNRPRVPPLPNMGPFTDVIWTTSGPVPIHRPSTGFGSTSGGTAPVIPSPARIANAASQAHARLFYEQLQRNTRTARQAAQRQAVATRQRQMARQLAAWGPRQAPPIPRRMGARNAPPVRSPPRRRARTTNNSNNNNNNYNNWSPPAPSPPRGLVRQGLNSARNAAARRFGSAMGRLRWIRRAASLWRR